MDKSISWTEYLDARVDSHSFASSQKQCRSALSQQRELIGLLVKTLGARSITCLGSGYLNDLPVSILFADGNEVTLIDWIEGISREGVASQVIQKCGNEYHCLFCDKNIGSAYCKSFTNELLQEGVCTAFVPVEDTNLTCQNYRPNTEPRFIKCDITAGYSSYFAEVIGNKIRNCRTPKEAFLKAIKLCSQIESRSSPVPVADSSMDLVTSSMVLSQFDNEPYNFFALLLEQVFGREQIILHQQVLNPLMEQLRTKLFVQQVTRHVQEMHRLVKKDGEARVYLSVELFRSDENHGLYFLVQDIAKAMDIVGEYFLFDLEIMPQNEILNHVQIDSETSVIQNYVLVPYPH